jgi:hypothetical protein
LQAGNYDVGGGEAVLPSRAEIRVARSWRRAKDTGAPFFWILAKSRERECCSAVERCIRCAEGTLN